MTDINTDASSGVEAKPREGVAETVASVKAEAAHFAAAAGDKAQEKFAQGQTAVGGGIHQFADALREAGRNLDQQDQSLVSGLVKQAADGLESVSRVVADKRPDEILRAVRDFGRANPTALIAASVLAGVALGRLARSSGEHVHADGDDPRLASGDTSSAYSENDPSQSGDLGSQGLEASQRWAGAKPVSPGDALTDADSLSVLGDPGGVEADDAGLAVGRPGGFGDDREG